MSSDSSITCDSSDMVAGLVEVDIVDSYSMELAGQNAVTTLNITCFLLQDYSLEENILMEKKYILVTRHPHKFLDDSVKWIYGCSCQIRISTFVQSLAFQVEMDYEEFVKKYETCLHIRSLKQILYEFENQNDNDACNFSISEVIEGDHSYLTKAAIHSISGKEQLLCVLCDHNMFGVVGWVKGELCCCCCPGTLSGKCLHVKEVADILEAEGENPDFICTFLEARFGNSAVGSKSPWFLRAKSYLPIPFELPDQLKETMFRTPDYNLIPAIPESNSGYSNCQTCGSTWESKSPTAHGWLSTSCKLVLRRSSLNCQVYYLPCINPSCNERLEFDGGVVALLNMGKFVLTYGVLRDFMFHFLLGRCTMYTYYNIWMELMNDGGRANLKELISFNQWRASWYSFLELLDIDYSAGFCCPICKTEYLNVIVCDGTSLAFRQAFCSEITRQFATDPVEGRLFRNGSSHSERIYIEEKDIRMAVAQVTTKTSPEVLEAIYALIDAHPERYGSLRIFLAWCVSSFGYDTEWPTAVCEFIRAISKKSPVCAIFHDNNGLIALCNKLVEGYTIKRHPVDFKLLQNNCPLLFNFLCAVVGDGLPRDVIPLLKTLLAIAVKPFDNRQFFNDDVSSRDKRYSDLAFFPHHPLVRGRGNYILDRHQEPRADSCTKRYGRHPTLLPGIFLIHCRHGITYGFSVMTSCESPNIPFSVFRSRFLRAPAIIVYDNACNLHTYCLNRDPCYFRNTRFLVDRLHWRDHTGCSSAYDLSSYPDLDFPYLNSQGAEQRNSSLNRIKASLSYMNERNFMNHCKLFLYYHNRKLALKLLDSETSTVEHS